MVSVIIPNYNKGEFLRSSLDSLMRQSYSDWQAVVVDDCSTDNSWDIICEYAKKDSRFLTFRNEVNKGGCYSRNFGAKKSSGEFLIFLDSDDWLADDCLAERVKEFECADNDNVDMLIFTMGTVKHGKLTGLWKPDTGNALLHILRHSIPWSIMMPIWRKVAFERIGGFDEGFPRLQDVELHTRALLMGVKYHIAKRSSPDCFYVIDETRMTCNYDRAMEIFVRATEMYVAKMSSLIQQLDVDREACSGALSAMPMVAIRVVGDAFQAGHISTSLRDSLYSRIISISVGGGENILNYTLSHTDLVSTTLKDSISCQATYKPLLQRRILFFVPEGNLLKNGVYASQVGGLAHYVETLGAEVMIWQNVNFGKMWFFQCINKYKKASKENLDLLAFRPTHIYCRTYQTCLAARFLAHKTGAKLVYSMRGADVAEALLGRNMRGVVLALYASWCVRKAVRIADYVNAVSNSMAEWIWRKWHRKASVLPCCVADEAFGSVNNSKIEHKNKTVVYCGGLSTWQKIDDIISLMKQMGDIDKTLKFRFLTKDVEELTRKCKMFNFLTDRWTCKACTPSEVALELAQANCGIILRDDTHVNRVASPIKVGEYLVAGLGVITSPFIGDVARDLANKPFAKLVTTDTNVKELVAFVHSLNEQTRNQAQNWARERLTYAGNQDVVVDMFG